MSWHGHTHTATNAPNMREHRKRKKEDAVERNSKTPDDRKSKKGKDPIKVDALDRKKSRRGGRRRRNKGK